MNKKSIRAYLVCQSVFDSIMEDFCDRIEFTDDIAQYYKGYKDKKKMYTDGVQYIICQEYVLAEYCDLGDISDWKQCVIRLKPNLDKPFERDINGMQAYVYMHNMLLKFYTEDEFKAILSGYTNPYNKELKQQHFEYGSYETEACGYITKHIDCYYYDINMAHGYALTVMFPKAKDRILKMYKQRKKNPLYKKYINYFVGMLKHFKYEGAYNFIVQLTTMKLKTAIEKCDGDLVYVNTDGFIVSKPNNHLVVSKALGDFKLEFQGNVYTYTGKNYWCFQTEDSNKPKGSLLDCVKSKVDLRKGIVTKYDIKIVGPKGKAVKKAINVENKEVEICQNEL